MGGGGGINPLSIITTMVFGPEYGGLVAMATADNPGSGGSSTTAGGDTSAQEADVAAAEARRKAARQRTEAAMLAKTRHAERAELSSENGLAQSLGSPDVATAQLKEKLGQ